VVDGLSTWVVNDGQAIAEVGDPAPTSLRLQQPWDGHRDLERLPDGRWLLQARTRGVVLRVLAADDPVLFGLHESTLFNRIAARLAVALEREHYEEEYRQVALLVQEADHLRRIADLKDDVLSTLSHELRTPLTVIGGNTELLLERWDDLSEEDRQNLVARVGAHAAMLARTVEDTLRLASLRAGQVPVRPREIDLRDLVVDAVRPLDGNGRVVVDVPELRVIVDGELVGDVVARLVSNGLKHASGEVAVRAEVDGQDLIVRVADDGPGFADLDQNDIFTPFGRGGNVLVRTTRGMGVGLAVVAATAEVIDGAVQVEQTSDEGATVRFVVRRSVVGIPQTVD
jgi:K+-sensing histidine kinase KdpD